MNPSTSVQDLAAKWIAARRLYPIYFELAREFVIDVQPCPDLEAGVEAPGRDAVEHASRWLSDMDAKIQVHQLRQFLQTSALVDQESLVQLLKHHLGNAAKSDAVRDKIDFLLVQYFSQIAPSQVNEAEVDMGFVANALEPVLGPVDLKMPVWLNALDRVRESARRCTSLDELLHGGILAQGRKAKLQAGDLFFLPVALVAFTRFGYLMRRVFFRLMHADLNVILDGLNELENKGIQTLDCRRAQFSADEPISRLRMICQSWKVMFQAEYSSGQPLRMLVDLRASVEYALGRRTAQPAAAKPATAPTPAPVSKPLSQRTPVPIGKPMAKAAAASVPAAGSSIAKPANPKTPVKAAGKLTPAKNEAPEFEVSSDSGSSSES